MNLSLSFVSAFLFLSLIAVLNQQNEKQKHTYAHTNPTLMQDAFLQQHASFSWLVLFNAATRT